MSNPDPARITNEMWRLWIERPNPAWKLSGIYADKKAYHNTVNANLARWPGNYSIRLPLDLVLFNRDKARAIDLTMSDSEMIKWTTRMRNVAYDPFDTRLAAVKEFYGTLDGKTVYGLSKDSERSVWRRVTADDTHLWHGHVSIFTAFVADWTKLSPLISVWRGDSYTEWSMSKMQLPQKGDSGEVVRYWQQIHNLVRNTVSPASPNVNVDGEYGPSFAAAVLDFWKKSGGSGTTFKGDYITGWLGTKYHAAFVRVSAPVPVIPKLTPAEQEELKKFVNAWLAENVPGQLILDGSVKGSVKLR